MYFVLPSSYIIKYSMISIYLIIICVIIRFRFALFFMTAAVSSGTVWDVLFLEAFFRQRVGLRCCFLSIGVRFISGLVLHVVFFCFVLVITVCSSSLIDLLVISTNLAFAPEKTSPSHASSPPCLHPQPYSHPHKPHPHPSS